jgi:membrane glycosyltransferase
VLSGLLLSIPLAVFTSREKFGGACRRLGLFLVPEEIVPPREIEEVRRRLREESSAGKIVGGPDAGVRDAVLDPYINAIHVSLLREQQMNPNNEKAFRKLGVASVRVRELGEKLLAQGPDGLSTAEQVSVLSDPEALSWLHHETWSRSDGHLADCWRAEIKSYAT